MVELKSNMYAYFLIADLEWSIISITSFQVEKLAIWY